MESFYIRFLFIHFCLFIHFWKGFDFLNHEQTIIYPSQRYQSLIEEILFFLWTFWCCWAENTCKQMLSLNEYALLIKLIQCNSLLPYFLLFGTERGLYCHNNLYYQLLYFFYIQGGTLLQEYTECCAG